MCLKCGKKHLGVLSDMLFMYILLVNVTYFFSPFSSRAHSPMIAVGSDDNSPNILAKVQIYEYNENTR